MEFLLAISTLSERLEKTNTKLSQCSKNAMKKEFPLLTLSNLAGTKSTGAGKAYERVLVIASL
jgi:hypothetical protein